MVNHGVLVDAGTDEEPPPVIAPFVLQVTAIDVDALCDVVVVTYGHVVEVIVVIFESGDKFRRHEPQLFEIVGHLRPAGHNEVVGTAIGIGGLPAAVIAFPFGVLGCCEDVEVAAA